jgi:hypothetical protein
MSADLRGLGSHFRTQKQGAAAGCKEALLLDFIRNVPPLQPLVLIISLS